MQSIKVIAPIEDLSAYGEVSRRYIRFFLTKGLKVTVQVASSVGTKVPASDYEDLRSLVGLNQSYDSVITFLEPDEACEYLRLESVERKVLYYNPKVSELYEPWKLFLAHYPTEIWVPGEWSADMLSNVLSRGAPRPPVRAAPTPLLPDEQEGKGRLTLKAPSGSTPITDKTLIFYTIGRWTEHRNFSELIESFFAAFQAKEDVCLVIKTYGQESNDVAFVGESIKRIRDYGKFTSIPNVLILNDLWPRKYIAALHRTAHCYVSASRYEGASINIHDALSFGNRAIFTGLGDTYKSPHLTIPVEMTWRPVRGMPRTGYTPDLFWAQPDLNHLIDQMKGAYQSHWMNDLFGSDERGAISKDINSNFRETNTIEQLME